MIKDLYTQDGEHVGQAIFHKRNSTVSVVYAESAPLSNVKLAFDEFDQYKASMNLLFDDELPDSQIRLDDLL